MLLFCYILALALQLVMLAGCLKKPVRVRWSLLFLCELCALTAAVYFSIYYNALPGDGMMPGLTYFAETLYSMAGAVVYLGMLLVSVLACVIVKLRNR
jgi:drug/metabolite transporter (DMT)-like permease